MINGLTDLRHPCQVLADLQTVIEEFGSLDGRVVAWIGDGNNMANSWIEAAGLLGFELRLACPEGYEPDHEIFDAQRRVALVCWSPRIRKRRCAVPTSSTPTSGLRWDRRRRPTRPQAVRGILRR